MKKMLIAAVAVISVIASIVGCQVYDQNSNEPIYTAMNRDDAVSWEKYAQSINDQYKICAKAITDVTVDVSVDVKIDVINGVEVKQIGMEVSPRSFPVDNELLDHVTDTMVDCVKAVNKDTLMSSPVDLIAGVTLSNNIDSALENILEKFLEFDSFFTVARKKVTAVDADVDFYDVEAIKDGYINNSVINAKGRLKTQIAYIKGKYMRETDNETKTPKEMKEIEGLEGYYVSRVKLEDVSLKDLWAKEYKLKWDYNSKK